MRRGDLFENHFFSIGLTILGLCFLSFLFVWFMELLFFIFDHMAPWEFFISLALLGLLFIMAGVVYEKKPSLWRKICKPARWVCDALRWVKGRTINRW